MSSAERQEQLRARVVADIREQILDRKIRPGDGLRLNRLAESLGTSVTPVREALLLLAQDGWVVHEPNRGFRVAQIRRSDVADTYFIWATAEGEIAARAATRATARDVAVLREIDEQLRAIRPEDGQAATELNGELHSVIYEVADAPKLEWFVEAARRLVPFQIPNTFYQVPNWFEENRTAHGPIIDALARGDVDYARTEMFEHLRRTGDMLLAWLDSMSFWSDAAAANGRRQRRRTLAG